MQRQQNKVAAIGLWHLGTVSAACLADLGYLVVGIDPNAKTISDLNKNIPPIYEPGLTELITKLTKSGALSFTDDFKEGLKGAKYVLVAFDTQVKDDDTPDITLILESIEKALPHLEQDALVIISSQVPLGTCDMIRKMIAKKRPKLSFGLSCVPENLKLGDAIARFKTPDLVVIGAQSQNEQQRTDEFYSFAASPKVMVDLRTAEMIKHAINGFLACEISFANELGNLCDKLGVDEFKVAQALKLEPRIGKGALLRAGLGFAGGTIARDVNVIRKLGRDNNSKTKLFDAIIQVNADQNKIIETRLTEIFGKLKGLRVGVLGITYKPGTNTIRRSVSIEIIDRLIGAGVLVRAYDPKADLSSAKSKINFEVCANALDVASSADALLILTGWPEFKELEFSKMQKTMKTPVVIDMPNLLERQTMEKLGFSYMGIGRGDSYKKVL